MQTITLKNKIRQETMAYNELQNLGFHIVINWGIKYIDFYGQWLAFKTWVDMLNFINSL